MKRPSILWLLWNWRKEWARLTADNTNLRLMNNILLCAAAGLQEKNDDLSARLNDAYQLYLNSQKQLDEERKHLTPVPENRDSLLLAAPRFLKIWTKPMKKAEAKSSTRQLDNKNKQNAKLKKENLELKRQIFKISGNTAPAR